MKKIVCIVAFILLYFNNNSLASEFSFGASNMFDKKPFITFNLFEQDWEFNPYIGVGYAFSIANYKENANNYGSAVPQYFNNAYFLIGTNVNTNLLFEISGTTGGTTYVNGGSANLNAIHFNVGWIFGEELLGEYGDKNKFIVLAGLVLGITNVSVAGQNIANNYVNVAPEFGIAYQRYITHYLSLRFDARASSLKVYDSNGSIMGTFIGNIIFHL